MKSQPLSSSPVAGWGRIDIERFGGLAAYGMPGSRIRSRGAIMAKDLSISDQALLRELFLSPAEAPSWLRDSFRYHLTRQSDCGPQTVIVGEAGVPESIRDAVHDELMPRDPAPPPSKSPDRKAPEETLGDDKPPENKPAKTVPRKPAADPPPDTAP